MVSETRDVTLSQPEIVVLARLMHLVVELDDDTSPEESDELVLVARQVGEEGFWSAYEAAITPSPNDIADIATQVERRPAQELMYGLLEEVAVSDGESESEGTVLEVLRHAWSLED